MINIDRLGVALWGARQVGRFSQDVDAPPVEPGFHLLLSIGRFDVFPYELDDGQSLIVMRWSRLIPPGNQLGVARSLLSSEEQERTLSGDFELIGAAEWGVHNAAADDSVLRYQLAVKNSDNRTYDEIADVIELEANQLIELLGTFEELVSFRNENDRTLEEDDRDWPGAVKALLDDATSVSMLGIIFERFEMNSVHEHVFYHPGADQDLRERIVRSWDSVAGMDRPQPYGDPAADSGTFIEQRQESIAHLRRSTD